MFIIGALQIGTIYARTYNEFLVVRALFGIGMGGVWGNAIAMGLEAVPVEARGLLSGILQQGYSLGYLLAAAFTLAFASEGSAPDSYKILFWIGAGGSFTVGIIRILFPESEQFIKAKKEGTRGGHTKKFIGMFPFQCASDSSSFTNGFAPSITAEAGIVLRTQWKLIIYACIVSDYLVAKVLQSNQR